ncbi:MAG: hypothetical protein GY864_06150 [Desulfobacterales bacterium]|nr:hypothetical protein [Desulfobacterales bacterium]
MDDLIINILLVILGFLCGVGGNIIVRVNNEKRKNNATLAFIRSEIDVFIRACEHAEKCHFWDSSTVETLVDHIAKSYSQNLERFISASNPKARQGLIEFYLEVNATLLLIERYRKGKERDGFSTAIEPGAYKGVAERSKGLLDKI